MGTTHEKFTVFGKFHFQKFQDHDPRLGMEMFLSEKAAKAAVWARWHNRRDGKRSVSFNEDDAAIISQHRDYYNFHCEEREDVFMDLYYCAFVEYDEHGNALYIVDGERYAMLTVGPRGGILKEGV